MVVQSVASLGPPRLATVDKTWEGRSEMVGLLEADEIRNKSGGKTEPDRVSCG
jgi:hypothetical protein